MWGNVWEWTLTRDGLYRTDSSFRSAYRWDDGRNDLNSHHSAYRVLKGGDGENVCGRRTFYALPGLRDIGFRVILSARVPALGTAEPPAGVPEEDLDALYIAGGPMLPARPND